MIKLALLFASLAVASSARAAEEDCALIKKIIASAETNFSSIRGAKLQANIYATKLPLPGVEDSEDCTVSEFDKDSWSYSCRWDFKAIDVAEAQAKRLADGVKDCLGPPNYKSNASDSIRSVWRLPKGMHARLHLTITKPRPSKSVSFDLNADAD